MYLTGQPRGVTPYPFESWKGVVPYEYIFDHPVRYVVKNLAHMI